MFTVMATVDPNFRIISWKPVIQFWQRRCCYAGVNIYLYIRIHIYIYMYTHTYVYIYIHNCGTPRDSICKCLQRGNGVYWPTTNDKHMIKSIKIPLAPIKIPLKSIELQLKLIEIPFRSMKSPLKSNFKSPKNSLQAAPLWHRSGPSCRADMAWKSGGFIYSWWFGTCLWLSKI